MVRGFPGASEVFIVHKNLPLVDQQIIFSNANKDSWFAFKFITPNYDVKLIAGEMTEKLERETPIYQYNLQHIQYVAVCSILVN